MPTRTPTHLKDLKPDPENRRKHNPRNLGMVVDALQQVGAARSIVIDEHNVVLAGNGVSEAAAEAGITRVQVVDVDGSTLVAVRRRGLTADQKRSLALYDNRTAELAEWDAERLQADLDGGLDLRPWFSDDETRLLLGHVDGISPPDLPNGPGGDIEQMTFTVHRDQAITIRAAVDRAKALGHEHSALNENSNGNALTAICENFRG